MNVGALSDILACVAGQRAQRGRVGVVFVWMVCQRRCHEWRAYMDGMLLLLLLFLLLLLLSLLLFILLLLKYYSEEQNVECLLLKQKWKMFQIDLNSDLKEEPDLKSRCLVYTFWTGNARALNMHESLKYAQMWANIPRFV